MTRLAAEAASRQIASALSHLFALCGIFSPSTDSSWVVHSITSTMPPSHDNIHVGRRCLSAIAFIAIIAAGCRSPSPLTQDSTETLDTTAIRASIDSLAANVMRSHETGDAELFATTWAKDGIMSDAGTPPVHGRDSIVARFRRRPPLPPGAKMIIHPTELRIQSAEWAYVMGVDTLTSPSSNDSGPTQKTFTFLVVLRKTSEGWQTYREVLSANQ